MYFSGKCTSVSAVTLTAYLVLIYLQPFISGRRANGLSTGSSSQVCPTARGVPSNILVTQSSQSFSDVSISWDAPTNSPCATSLYQVSYELLYKDMCDRRSTGVRQWNVRHPQTHATITRSLFANSEYMICVQPWNAYILNWGDTVCVNFTTRFDDPAPVRDLIGTTRNNRLWFSWSPPQCGERRGPFHCYNYSLIRKNNRHVEDSKCLDNIQTTQRTYEVNLLRGCTSYIFKVQVVTGTSNDRKESTLKKVEQQTPITAPGSVSNIRVSQYYGLFSAAKVTWEAPVDSPCEADEYIVTSELLYRDRCDTSSAGRVNEERRTQHPTTITVQGLIANSIYNICVFGRNNGGEGEVGCTNFTTGPKDPDPLQTPTVTQLDDELQFSWIEPNCGELHGTFFCYNYRLIRKNDGRIVRSGLIYYRFRTQTTYRFDTLRACTAYKFEVQVMTGTGNNRKRSRWEKVDAQTPTIAPGAPIIVDVSQLSGSVTVTWEAPINSPCEADGYRVTYKLINRDMCNSSPDVQDEIRNVENQRRQDTINSLLPHSEYKICVRGSNEAGDGQQDCERLETEITEPTRPPKRVNYTVSYSSLTFTWDKPKCGDRNGPITGYDYILKGKGNDVLRYGKVKGGEGGGVVNINELIPDTTYYFSVRANNSNFAGRYGKEHEANTSMAVYNPPRNVNVTTYNETTAVVKWNTPKSSGFNATGYRIEWGNSSRKATAMIFVPCEEDWCPLEGLSEVTITELTPATNYYLQVIAKYKYDEKASSQLVFKTPSEDVGSSSRASGNTMIPVVAIIFVIIIVLLFVVASQLYSRKTNKQLFKWPELFAFSLPGILNSLRGTDRTNRGSAQIPNTHTTRDVNGDGMEMNVTCDVSQSDNHACNSEMESDLSPAIYENVTSQTRKHTVIPVGQLLGYVARKNAGGFGSFDADFKSLPSNDLHSQDIASQESNKEKNRFKNILPYDHSRVKLSVLNDDPSSDYINASFIDGYRKPKKYIAGQGPNIASMDDFWRMVWQYNSRKIVMLTNLREANKKKCEKYWPARSDTFGGIVVTMAKEEVHDHYTVRYFNLVCNNTGRDVIQYHYTTWPDMGVPEYSAHLMSFLKITRQTSGPAIVHCSAGVGRTGTFLALDAMLDQVEAEQAVDIHSFIANMRQKRPLMVQTKKQYRFIYEALVQELTCGDTSIEQNVFTETYHSLLSKKKGTTVMQQQYELLEALTVNLQDEEVAAARTKENAGKNRFQDKVPAGRTRPFLMTAVEGSTDYINASFLPGCVSRNQYIGAQTPLPNTVADFWRLVVDYKVNTIVMLHGNSRDKTYAQYWNKEESTQYGSFKVQVIKEEYNRPIMFRTMEVTDTDSKKASSRTVKQFQLASCPPKSEVPPMADVMQLYKALISDAGSTDWKEGNSPLLIHCRDGEGITGAFCAFMSVMDHLNTKQTIDVFHACKRLRTSRPGAVATLAQYQFIYEAVKSYLMSTSIYENMAKIV